MTKNEQNHLHDQLAITCAIAIDKAHALADMLCQDYFGKIYTEAWEIFSEHERMTIYAEMLFDYILGAQKAIKEAVDELVQIPTDEIKEVAA